MGKLTEKLALDRCRCSSVESVKKLNLWASEIDDISIVRRMRSVEVISLSANEITTLEPFQYCMNLQELFIRKNNIADLSQIYFLKFLPKLRILWLADNPCAVGDRYRLTVLRHLPNLTKLDNIIVTDNEKNDALDDGAELRVPKGLLSAGEREVLADEVAGDHVMAVPATGDEKETKIGLEETNAIRIQLGLQPLPSMTVGLSTSAISSKKSSKTSCVLQAVLLLLNELDPESLDMVTTAAIRAKQEAIRP